MKFNLKKKKYPEWQSFKNRIKIILAKKEHNAQRNSVPNQTTESKPKSENQDSDDSYIKDQSPPAI